MSWCHRIAKQRIIYSPGDEENFYSIREYYPDLPDGEAWTVDPIAPTGESLDDLEWALKAMLRAVKEAKKDKELILELDENNDKVNESENSI